MTDIIGNIPNRMAFAGGWIDQPFVSKHNPDGIGSMVVVGLEPNFRFMDRCGMASSTRRVATEIWKNGIPGGDRETLVKELYRAENEGKGEPSGSQDMVGLVYPGISRLDYSYDFEDGYFPIHIESCVDEKICTWLEDVLWVLPVVQRPPGYNPLEIKNLDPPLIGKLGKTGVACYEAILACSTEKLGRSFNDCMELWERILPGTVHHHTLTVDLKQILAYYQERYAGAMYSGCGGGYLYVISESPVPGGFSVTIRTNT